MLVNKDQSKWNLENQDNKPKKKETDEDKKKVENLAIKLDFELSYKDLPLKVKTFQVELRDADEKDKQTFCDAITKVAEVRVML